MRHRLSGASLHVLSACMAALDCGDDDVLSLSAYVCRRMHGAAAADLSVVSCHSLFEEPAVEVLA